MARLGGLEDILEGGTLKNRTCGGGGYVKKQKFYGVLKTTVFCDPWIFETRMIIILNSFLIRSEGIQAFSHITYYFNMYFAPTDNTICFRTFSNFTQGDRIPIPSGF